MSITATTSLDGVLLSCSEDVASLAELMDVPFDELVLTLKPLLVGSDDGPVILKQSVPLALHSQQTSTDGLCLTYRRQPIH